MTEGLKELLRKYGLLSVTLSQLMSERPGTQFESLDDYYKKLGSIESDEPVLAVKISKDGCFHSYKDGDHDFIMNNEKGEKVGNVMLLELPEDEFWFFEAFRPGLFELQKGLPIFVYEMAIVHLYAIFEAYLSDLLKARFQVHPRLMGSRRHVRYEHIFESSSKAQLVDAMIEREVRDLMYLPFLKLIKNMREKLGFGDVTVQYDECVNYISLVRNCLLHNGGRVDFKLACFKPELNENDKISLNMDDLGKCVNVLRKLAYEIDKSFEDITRRKIEIDPT